MNAAAVSFNNNRRPQNGRTVAIFAAARGKWTATKAATNNRITAAAIADGNYNHHATTATAAPKRNGANGEQVPRATTAAAAIELVNGKATAARSESAAKV